MTEIRGHHDRGQTCQCVKAHRPPYMELEHHHIWPIYLGGPNVPENMIWICPQTHTNVHEIIRMFSAAGRLLTHVETVQLQRRPVPQYAYDLAARGFLHHTLNMQQQAGES